MATKPRHNVVSAVVRQADRTHADRLGRRWGHVQSGADLVKGKVTRGVKLNQLRGEVITARL